MALAHPGRLALADLARALTYAELAMTAEALGRRLVARGTGPGDRVGVMVARGVDLVVALLGVSAAGAAYVPLDPGYPVERLRTIVADAELAVLVTDGSGPEFDVPMVHVTSSGRAGTDLAEIVLPAPSPHNPGYVIYTSGSTGRPKGVVVTNANVVALFDALDETYGSPFDDTFLAVTSVSFDIAIMELLWPLTRGGVSVVSPAGMINRLDSRSDGNLPSLMRRFRPTLFQSTPALLSAIASYEEALRSLRGLRVLCVGGEVFPIGLARRLVTALPDVRVFNLYGPTEATVWCAVHEVTPAETRLAAVAVGRPLRHAALRVVDDTGRDVPPGDIGELWVGGPCVTAGYFRLPDLTEERFVDEAGAPARRWYRTGDRARTRPDGMVEFVGRVDRQVKISGVRIELDEIESVLSTAPELRAAAVVAQQGSDGEHRLVAYVMPIAIGGNRRADPESSAESDHIRQHGQIWDAVYTRDPDAEFAGWRSSYTGEPIPVAEMREWLDNTMRQLEPLRPRRILDVGVGAGLVLRNFAHRAERYLGIDVSPAAIDAAAREVDAGRDRVSLRVGDADELAGLGSGEFDLVVFNSVVQYFPSRIYLRRVLAEAVRIAGPDGAVFVGDVRDQELLEAFHTTVVFHRAQPDTPAAELTAMVRRQVSLDAELSLSGEFFADLAAGVGMRVTREIKRGVACNELTSFRYDVTLLGAQRAAELDKVESDAESVPWEHIGDLAGMKELLERAGPGSVTVTGIPNPRLVRPLALCGLLAEAAPTDPALDIARRLADCDHAEVPDIESVAELDQSGRSVRFVPDASGARRYDARFGRRR